MTRTVTVTPGGLAARPLPFPAVDAELVEALERAFPDRCPDAALSHDEIRERIGETRVVRFLRRQLERQRDANQERVL